MVTSGLRIVLGGPERQIVVPVTDAIDLMDEMDKR